VIRKIEPPAWLLANVVAMVALGFLFPVIRVIPSPYRYLGILPILAGVAVNVWADGLFKRAKTTVKPSETPTSLIVEGPFRFSRHPMYLGMCAVLAGVAALLGALTPWLVVPPFVAAMEMLFIRSEEKAMRQAFGESYQEYKRRVRRWL